MADFEENHFSIDPGIGKKMPGCPSSQYEDGHDVREYIIAPKGYVFTGFKFEPLLKNQIYNGRLVAQYDKLPFKNRVSSNLWKFFLAFGIIAIIGLIVFLASGVFKDPTPKTPNPQKPNTEIAATSKDQKDKKTKQESKKRKNRKAKLEQTENDLGPDVKKATKAEKPQTDASNAQPTPTVTEVTEPQPTAAEDPNTLFTMDFWELIHERNSSMDSYTDLYNNFKGKVTGVEYDYLRFTILKDYVSFKAWYENLKKIPEKELESIDTIDNLIKLMK